jgi:hypothetical protein
MDQVKGPRTLEDVVAPRLFLVVLVALLTQNGGSIRLNKESLKPFPVRAHPDIWHYAYPAVTLLEVDEQRLLLGIRQAGVRQALLARDLLAGEA